MDSLLGNSTCMEKENIKKIVSEVGEIVEVDEEVIDLRRLDKARVLI